MKLTRIFSASGITLVLAASSLAGMSPAFASVGMTGVQPSAIVTDSNHSQIVDVFTAINNYRVSQGLTAFRYNSTISASSQKWSDTLSANGQPTLNPNFNTDPTLQGSTSSSEIVGGQWDRSAAELVAQWVASPAYNSVLTNPNMNTIGIGITYTDSTAATSPNTYATYGVVDAFQYSPELAGTSSSPTESCFTAGNGSIVCVDNGFNPADSTGTGGTSGTPTPTITATAPPPPPSPTPTPTVDPGTPTPVPMPTVDPGTPTPVPTTTDPGTPTPTPTVDPVTPISTKYDASNGLQTLGAPTGPETAVNGGSVREYANGTIYWSPARGAYVSTGDINAMYKGLGGETGVYGWPTSDIKTSANGGLVQNYEHGDIYKTAAGTFFSFGAIRSVYRAFGAETGLYGYPLSNERPSVNGGVSQAYEHATIYWSPATGVNPTFGAIRWLHNANGAERGYLGYPTSGEIPTGRGGGVIQNYQHGSIVWSPATGVNTVIGAIGGLWKANGGADGYFGYPTSGEIPTGRGGGTIQNYEHGSVVWSPATGVNPVIGAIGAMWKAYGGASGYFGYPTSSETPLKRGGGTYQSYQYGTIVWTPGYGTFLSIGGIRSVWASTGYESGRLGWPTSNEYPIPGGVAQNYYGGRISFMSNGAVTVSYN